MFDRFTARSTWPGKPGGWAHVCLQFLKNVENTYQDSQKIAIFAKLHPLPHLSLVDIVCIWARPVCICEWGPLHPARQHICVHGLSHIKTHCLCAHYLTHHTQINTYIVPLIFDINTVDWNWKMVDWQTRTSRDESSLHMCESNAISETNDIKLMKMEV